MNRVVCPVCKAGFEARFSRENCAINCVSCGVAFNASSFLPKSDTPRSHFLAAKRPEPRQRYTGPVLVDSRKDKEEGTRTGGLPFPDSTPMPPKRASVEMPAPLPIIPRQPNPARSAFESPAVASSSFIAPAASAEPQSIPPTKKLMSAFTDEFAVKLPAENAAVSGLKDVKAPQASAPGLPVAPAVAKPEVKPKFPIVDNFNIEPLVRPWSPNRCAPRNLRAGRCSKALRQI